MPVKVITIIGIMLIVIGLVALVFQGINYTTREKVIDVGPLEATAEKEKTIPLSPMLGVVALVGGIIMVVAGSKKS
jgi:uncharacterized membrane protein HdeD (DUF308 family)